MISTKAEISKPYQAPENGWRTFLIVWVTQSISVFGSALTFFSLTIWLTQVLYSDPAQKTQLAFALSATGLAWALPNVFFAPIAGAWADRHDRKRIMMIMDFMSGCLSLTLMLLIITHLLQLWMLVILLILFSISAAFHGSAFDTSYAMIVPERLLPRANGMMQTIQSLSTILSPAIAATLIGLPAIARQGSINGILGQWLKGMVNGTPLTIAIDALTFFIAAGTLIFLTIPSPKRTDLAAGAKAPTNSLWADIREGGLYIWHRRPMLWLLGTFTVANLVGSFMVLVPLFVKYNLAVDWSVRGYTLETALALLASVGGIGGVLGGIFISAWGGLKKKRVYGVLVALIIAGLAMMVYGASPLLYLAAASAALVQGMIPIMNAHSQTIWQTQTPRDLQGRVFSVRRLIAQFTFPLGTALAGILGGAVNPGILFLVMGTFQVLFCFAQLFNPYLLRVEDKVFLDELAAVRAR